MTKLLFAAAENDQIYRIDAISEIVFRITRFSNLDLSNQKLISKFVSHALLRDINRRIEVEEIIRLFSAYDVEIERTQQGTFSICSHEKLEQAVKQILAG